MRFPLFICGSTASGKSSLAIKIAQKYEGEIINADAFQIYKGIETLSAAPSPEDTSSVPHHLYSTLPVTSELNANLYREMALPIIQEVQAKGKLPIITGGSGMYLKFLTHGPSPIPASDPTLRAELEARELIDLIEELRTCDPEVLATFPPENKRYVVRALEIYRMTGEKASVLKSHWNTLPNPAPRGLLICPTKEETLLSIEQRARVMLDSGAIQEVQNLPPDADIPTASKAIGVREIRAYLDNTMTLEQCRERLIISTRQYAKRQRNWFSHETWLHRLHPAECDPLPAILTELAAS